MSRQLTLWLRDKLIRSRSLNATRIVAASFAVIILTGIFGNLTAPAICKLFRITEPAAKGVGIGSAAHAIGTARALEIGPVEDIYGDKEHHPYTEGLFGAIPDIYTKVSRLNAIDGLMPDPTNLPQGCKFAPRCKHCMDICKVKPPGTWVQGEHKISCHLYAKEVE